VSAPSRTIAGTIASGATKLSRSPTTLVLVHGAWHGSWCWQRVAPLIERSGISVRTVDLPSTSRQPPISADLSGDALVVRKLIDELAGEVLVCGHSYGGMVISHSAVGSHPRVRHLIYLCAFMPDDGESLISIGGGKPAPWIETDERGMTLPDLSKAADLFYGDCDADTQRWAVGQLTAQPAAPFGEPVAVPAWRSIASTYIVCAQDRAMPAELQRSTFAPRAREVRELNTSHSPFLSQPALLADMLAASVEAR
jgi:pimeloyl-ACP methyl ester carboxylesterase